MDSKFALVPSKLNLSAVRRMPIPNPKKAGHTEVIVSHLPKCDFCSMQASYDGQTSMGPWANMCQLHFGQYGVGLGLGRGQKLVLKNKPIMPNKNLTPNSEYRSTPSFSFDAPGQVSLIGGVQFFPGGKSPADGVNFIVKDGQIYIRGPHASELWIKVRTRDLQRKIGNDDIKFLEALYNNIGDIQYLKGALKECGYDSKDLVSGKIVGDTRNFFPNSISTGSRKVIEPKDRQRIQEMVAKTEGNRAKLRASAQLMANRIKDVDKAWRRYKAATEAGYPDIARIFHVRYFQLGGSKGSAVPTPSKKTRVHLNRPFGRAAAPPAYPTRHIERQSRKKGPTKARQTKKQEPVSSVGGRIKMFNKIWKYEPSGNHISIQTRNGREVLKVLKNAHKEQILSYLSTHMLSKQGLMALNVFLVVRNKI